MMISGPVWQTLDKMPSCLLLQADFSRGYGTVLDSGTTFIYLPTAAYKAFFAAVKAAVAPAKLKTVSGSDPSVSATIQSTG